jgi:hypothetical protein
LIFFHIYTLSAWLLPVKRAAIDIAKRLVYYKRSAWLLQAASRKDFRMLQDQMSDARAAERARRAFLFASIIAGVMAVAAWVGWLR